MYVCNVCMYSDMVCVCMLSVNLYMYDMYVNVMSCMYVCTLCMYVTLIVNFMLCM